MKRSRDPLTIHNERMKLIAGFFNAIAIGLLGFAVLRPLVETSATPDLSALVWTGVGIAFHGLAHYVLGRLEKEAPHDAP